RRRADGAAASAGGGAPVVEGSVRGEETALAARHHRAAPADRRARLVPGPAGSVPPPTRQTPPGGRAAAIESRLTRRLSDAPKITTEKRGPLLLIGLNRPAKMNAFDADMLRALSDAFVQLENDAECRCGVVFAQGEHFTAGLDLMNVAPLMMQGKLDLAG